MHETVNILFIDGIKVKVVVGLLRKKKKNANNSLASRQEISVIFCVYKDWRQEKRNLCGRKKKKKNKTVTKRKQNKDVFINLNVFKTNLK